MRRERLRHAALLAAVGGVLALAGMLVPGTSGSFSASVKNLTDTARSKASTFTCGDTFAGVNRAGSAYFEYRLAEASDATVAADSSSAANTGAYVGSDKKDTATPIACPLDSGGAYLLNGTTSGVSTATAYGNITTNFSMEVWFRSASSTANGKLIGYESSQTGTASGTYDKHLYIGASGKLLYGIYPGTVKTLTTTAVVTDGLWHQAVATTSSTAGSVLYLDGVAVASDATMTTGQGFGGYWRLGYGNLNGWTDKGSSSFFAGSLRFAGAYKYVLTAGEVAGDYSIGKPA